MFENKEAPLVSVVIPCYNHEKYVQECIRSVIEQDYEDIELIIIDDGSKDESVSKIQELVPECEKRFRRFEFRTRSNKGLCETLNEAIAWCEGEYYSSIASDDIMRPYKTREQVEYLEANSSFIGVFGAVEILYKNGCKKEVVRKSNAYHFNDIFLHNHNLPAPTSMLRLEKVKEVNGYRRGFIIEDWIMWLDLTRSGGILSYLGRVFVTYRRHDGNLSGQLDKMYVGRLQVIDLFKGCGSYKKAKAAVYLVQAIDVQAVDRIKSVPFAVKSVFNDIGVVFTLRFLSYLMKMFLPRSG